MPKFPSLSPSTEQVHAGVYAAQPIAGKTRPAAIPLNVGDTWCAPAPGCRMQDLRMENHPQMHRYSPVPGYPALRNAIAAHHTVLSGVTTTAKQVIVTAGATAGLAAAVAALTAPGDEVLLCAPHWPLMAGSVRSFHAMPIAVPVMSGDMNAGEIVRRLARQASDRTAAIYWNTPNNPTGRRMPLALMQRLVTFAREHALWIFSDEVYEDYVYKGEHHYTRALAPERTISAHSFSKAYGMAGNRVGYLIGPEDAIMAIEGIMTNIAYSACSASQIAALSALHRAGGWLQERREEYAELGRWAAKKLGVAEPEGSTFLFIDVAAQLDHRGLDGFLADLAEDGVLLAPGPSFGPYPTHVRLCYTATEPKQVKKGIEILARRLRQP